MNKVWSSVVLIVYTCWIVVLTISVTQLTFEVADTKQKNVQLEQQIKEYKQQAEREAVVYEQLFTAMVKGMQGEW